jgi:hypothetical protein
MKYIYKITYPNGKVYVGQDAAGGFMNYFGSSDESYIEKDFTWAEMQNFSARKEVLWVSETADKPELDKKETEYILKYESNNPQKGCNQRLPVMP